MVCVKRGSPSSKAVQNARLIAHKVYDTPPDYGYYPTLNELGAALLDILHGIEDGRLSPSLQMAEIFEDCAAVLRDMCRTNPGPDDSTKERAEALTWKCRCVLHDSAPTAPPPPPSATA